MHMSTMAPPFAVRSTENSRTVPASLYSAPYNDSGETVQISARNQLSGRVTMVKLGSVMAEVTIDIGGHSIVSVITRGSAEHLSLREGDEVVAIIKASEILVGKP